MAACMHCNNAPKVAPSHHCLECQTLRLPVDVQILEAYKRRELAESLGIDTARVPRDAWPEGRRWCSGCLSYRRFDIKGRKLDVAPGHTKCRVCETIGRRLRTYGLTPEMDKALGTKCNICGRTQKFQALAIDHDHATGKLRGKLCLWCNHYILGPAEIKREPLEYFMQVVEYLEMPPMKRLT